MEAKKVILDEKELVIRDYAIGEILVDEIKDTLSGMDTSLIVNYGVYLAKVYGMPIEEINPVVEHNGLIIPSTNGRMGTFDKNSMLDVIDIKKASLKESYPDTIEILRTLVDELSRIKCVNCTQVYNVRQRIGALATMIYLIKSEKSWMLAASGKMMKQTEFTIHEENKSVYDLQNRIRLK